MPVLTLRHQHLKHGAHLIQRAGWQAPEHYGKPVEEHHAVRRRAGLSDQSFRGKLRIRGTERAEFLQGMVTNEVLKLSPGRGCYAILTSLKAKMLSDCRIYCLPDSFLLDLEPEVVESVLAHLDRYIIASDVTLENMTESWGILSLTGPKAPGLLSQTLSFTHLPEAEYDLLESRYEGIEIFIARNELTGEIGYDLICPTTGLEVFFKALMKADIPLIGQEALNTLRIEAGIPRYGTDMDETYFPMEAGLTERAISETKGCYIGQETIARALAQGRMNRLLVGLEVKGDAVPEPGRLIKAGDRDLGPIKSAVYSPSLKKVIAMGYVHRDFTQPGSDVSVTVGTEVQPATVVPLPFYHRPAE